MSHGNATRSLTGDNSPAPLSATLPGHAEDDDSEPDGSDRNSSKDIDQQTKDEEEDEEEESDPEANGEPGHTSDEGGYSEGESDAEPEDTRQQEIPSKHPLMTGVQRLSSSSLDEVNLSGNKEDQQNRQPSDVKGTAEASTESQSPGATTPSDQNHTLKALSGSLPAVPFAPPPPTPRAHAPAPTTAAQQPPPSQPSRGVFSWFTRSSSASKEIKTPSSTASSRQRGDTTTSASTVTSSIERASADAEHVNGLSKKPRRSSIRDQFKIVRMREEGTIAENDGASITSGQESPRGSRAEGEVADHTTGSKTSNSSATVNPSLAPGTVSGIHASATDVAAPVDWELWQQLVNQGPSALKGANADQLLLAVKRGIPQTIRGLIWQVLADSRNPELEEVYRGLVARGTENERHVNGVSNGIVSEKDKEESDGSSRSSVRSGHSGTGGASFSNGVSGTHEQDPEKQAKEYAAQQKKAKDDAVMLQKLEKAIRRDLGGRTSYSRYFVSQGSQDALFGLCKAYALYDESVGYAQGMNFIAMILLFNVSSMQASGRQIGQMLTNAHMYRWMKLKHLLSS